MSRDYKVATLYFLCKYVYSFPLIFSHHLTLLSRVNKCIALHEEQNV